MVKVQAPAGWDSCRAAGDRRKRVRRDTPELGHAGGSGRGCVGWCEHRSPRARRRRRHRQAHEESADTDNDAIPEYGPPADPADRKAIVGLIERYYEVAAAGDGARACSMLDATFVQSLSEEHRGRGPRGLRGDTCARILSKLFEQRHRELAEDLTGFRVLVVQVHGNLGYALMRFPAKHVLREPAVILRRTHGAWKMDVALDNGAQ